MRIWRTSRLHRSARRYVATALVILALVFLGLAGFMSNSAARSSSAPYNYGTTTTATATTTTTVTTTTTSTRRVVRVVRRCVVPRLIGKRLARARRLVVRARCRMGRVSRAYSRRIRRGLISAQRPRAGRRVARGTRVNVVVSRGPRR